ncbi:MAG: thiamine-phosphate kinase [Planctomycetes bacterium]|nr:thiamine-phosphate kinase [Planctomycetota bacterium]
MPARGGFRERAFHAWLRRSLRPGRGVAVGIGDDAAVLRLADKNLLATTDSLVEGVHFAAGTAPRLAGGKAAGRVLSDMAAMAATPRFGLLSLVVPPSWTARAVRRFVEEFEERLRRHGASLVGGDAACAPGRFVAAAALLGEPGARRPLLRSGARPGDLILATGSFGGSILGRHLRFAPRVREAIALARRLPITAAIDVSDGLALDLHRICAASRVGAVLEAGAIPVSRAARILARRTGRSPLSHALGDGEDHELLLAMRPSGRSRLERLHAGVGVPVSIIGRFGGRGVRIRDERGRERPLPASGWEHGSRGAR